VIGGQTVSEGFKKNFKIMAHYNSGLQTGQV